MAPRSCRREAELPRPAGHSGHGTGTPGMARAQRARHCQHPVQPWRGMCELRALPGRSSTEGLEGTTCERRRELNLHGGGASCLQGDVSTGYKYLQGNNGDRAGELFTGARWQGTERARGGGSWGRGHPEIGPAVGQRHSQGRDSPCARSSSGGVRVPRGELQPGTVGASSMWVLALGMAAGGRGWPGCGCPCHTGVRAGPASPILVLSLQKGTAIM